MTTKLQVSAIMLGVRDMDRAKKFYAEGLGGEVEQDFGGFVKIALGAGSPALALYEWAAAAQDAGVSAEGSGFRGSSFHFLAGSREVVDEIMQAAAAAGGTVVSAAVAAGWGGYSGYFADPDGYLWKIATAS
ncbi:VOC family protein [Crossiella sp. CA198]|uniref:VOC family protein n=1 Tax=Crossiella sp. CA198 TaxID=3455607 RepID=UPI003F8D0430